MLESLSPLTMSVFGLYEDAFKQTVQPFAWADAFLRHISNHSDQMILHFWPMENTLILGMLDRQVPYFSEGLQVIKNHGYQPIVRNIGGLGVISDDGIFNFSLILPNAHQLSINDAYLMMVELIREMFHDFKESIEHFEIPQSYCPGTFDLSINGKKFAGLAQRRVKDAVLVSAYLSVYGNQLFRGQLVKDFYEKGIKGQPTLANYPDIDPTCMSNLSDLLGISFSIEDIQHRILTCFDKRGVKRHHLHLEQELITTYDAFLAQHLNRNQSIIN